MPKTSFLQIRLSPEVRTRVERAAGAEYLDASTWARQAIMRALEEVESRWTQEESRTELPRRPELKVAEESRRKRKK